MYSQKQRRQYTAEFKLESVELLLRGNKSAPEVAADLGINPNLLNRWKREYQIDTDTAFPGTG